LIAYAIRYHDKLLQLLAEHLEILLIAVTVAFLIAFPLAMLMYQYKFLSNPINGICNAIFAIPTLAIFSILIPITGLGKTTAIITLVVYNQFILIKSISNAFESIEPEVIEAANGIGLNQKQVFFDVKLPLAMPAIVSGLRMSIVSTIAMATLAATIGAGGLGELIFFGLEMKKWSQIMWGMLLSSSLAFIANVVMQRLEIRVLNKSRGDVKPHNMKCR